jgi:hypothetical protein
MGGNLDMPVLSKWLLMRNTKKMILKYVNITLQKFEG